MTQPKRTQLIELSKPFAPALIRKKPDSSKAEYVSHSTVTERALQVIGNYAMEVNQLIYEDLPEKKTQNKTYPAMKGAVVGAIVTIHFHLDDELTSITEVGSCDNPHIRANNGDRAKHAVSDAVKRAWMRTGLGLHLWSREQYFLHKVLVRDAQKDAKASEEAAIGSDLPPASESPEIEPEGDDDPNIASVEEADEEGRDLGVLLDESEITALLDDLEDAGIPDEYQVRFIETVLSVQMPQGKINLTYDEANRVRVQAERYREQNPRASDFAPEPSEPLYPSADTPKARAEPQKSTQRTTDPPVKQSRPRKAVDETYIDTKGQTALHTQLSNYGFTKEQHYEIVSEILDREITSFAQIRTDEQGQIYGEARKRAKK